MSRWTDPLIRVHTGSALTRRMNPKRALRTIKRYEAEGRNVATPTNRRRQSRARGAA